jgi:MFS family permease
MTTSNEMRAIAVVWQIYGLTHRRLDLGLVGLAQFLPGVLLFVITGHTADRIPRRRILLVCCAAFAICSALLLAFAIHGLTHCVGCDKLVCRPEWALSNGDVSDPSLSRFCL